jgi:hypothetical protein
MDAGIAPKRQKLDANNGTARSGHGGYAKDYKDTEGSTSVVFTMKEEVGALAKALKYLKNIM